MHTIKTVGILGLGKMGGPMAKQQEDSHTECEHSCHAEIPTRGRGSHC